MKQLKRRGGTKLTSGTYTTMAHATYYLTQDVSFTKSVTSMSNVYFREASSLPPCANDSSVTKHPKLVFSSVSNVNSSLGFYVTTDIKYMYISEKASPTIEVARDLRIAQIQKEASSTYSSSLDFMLSEYLGDDNKPVKYSVVVGLMCKGSDEYSYVGNEENCNTNFNVDYTDVCEVKYCDETEGNGVNTIDCDGGAESANCTRTYSCSF